MKHFFENMFHEEEYIEDILRDPEVLEMNEETEKQFKAATKCYICQRPFTDKLIKVRDYDHLGVNEDSTLPNYS